MKTPETRIQSREFPWLKLLFGLTLLVALIWIVDWRQGWAVLKQTRPVWFCLASLAFPLGVFLSSRKWQMLLQAQGVLVSGWSLFRYYFIGFFASNFFPSNVGGDIIRLILIRKAVPETPVAGSIIVERLTGLAGLLTLALGAVLIRPEYFSIYGFYPLLFFGIVSGLVFFISLLFFNRVWFQWLSSRSFSSMSMCSKWLEKLRLFSVNIMEYGNHRRVLFSCFVISLIFYLTPAFLQWLLLHAVGVSLPFVDVFLISSIVQLISLLPVSFNALGLAEGATVIFFSQVGVAPAEALAVALLARFLGIMVSGVGGLFWFFEPTFFSTRESN